MIKDDVQKIRDAAETKLAAYLANKNLTDESKLSGIHRTTLIQLRDRSRRFGLEQLGKYIEALNL